MASRRRLGLGRIRVAAALLSAVLGAGAALAHGDPHTGHVPGAPAVADAGATKVTLHDIDLVERSGKRVRFKRDAVGERIVVIDFIYTTCTTICPVMSSILTQVQESLGERLGDDVRLLTLSIDPVRDTAKRMAESAARFDAGDHWLWLTGTKPAMDRVLTGLGAYAADIESHPAAVLIGDARSGAWTRLYGFVPPEDIVSRVEDLLRDRKPVHSSIEGESHETSDRVGGGSRAGSHDRPGHSAR